MSHHESAASGHDGRMVDRMLFFTDAVFAIMLTLLALDLRPPGVEISDDAGLARAIAEEARRFASFAISFALGSAFWLAHLRTSRLIRRFSWLTAAANLLHLLPVSLLPFAAGVLGQHIGSPFAFEIYGAIIMAVSYTGALFWWVATRANGRDVGGMSLRERIAGALRAGAIGIAFTGGVIATEIGEVNWARFCWVLVIPILTLARLVAGKPPPQPA